MIAVFEGLPGAGKTSLIKALAERYDSVVIDEIVLTPDRLDEAFYKKNDLAKSKIAQTTDTPLVLMDRWYASTAVYGSCSHQSTRDDIQAWIGSSLDLHILKAIDMVFYLDVDVATSLARRSTTATNWHDAAFARKVKTIYRQELHTLYAPAPVHIINANRDLAEVVQEVESLLRLTKEGNMMKPKGAKHV